MADFITINGLQHQIVYVDPNAKFIDGVAEGDGTSYDNVLFNIPSKMNDNALFLIRRSQYKYYADFPINQTFNNVKSLVIWGMPKPGDVHYSDVPSGVRTAWEDDDKPSAYVRFNMESGTSSSGSYRTTFTSCSNVQMHDVVLQCSGYAYDNNKPMVGFTSQFGTNVDIRKCKFMYRHQAVNTAEATAQDYMNSGDFMDGVIPTGSARISPFFSFYGDVYGHSSIVEDCEINCFSSYRGFERNVIDFGKVNYVSLKNVKVNVMCNGNDSSSCVNVSPVFLVNGGYNQYDDASVSKFPELDVRRVDVRVYRGSSGKYAGIPGIISGRVNYAFVDGMSERFANSDDDVDQKYETSQQFGYGSLLSLSVYSPGSQISNIDIDFPEFKGIGVNSMVRIYTGLASPDSGNGNQHYNKYPSFGQYTWVKNVNVVYGGTNSVANHGDNENGGDIVHAGNEAGPQEVCPIIGFTSSTSGCRHPSADIMVQDVNVRASEGHEKACAAYFSGCLLDLKACLFHGGVVIMNSIGKIGTVKIAYPGNAVRDDGGNLLYIGTITCSKDNPQYEYNAQNAVHPSYTSNMLVTNVNTLMMPQTFVESTQKQCTYICTNDGQVGNYTVRNGQHKCETWSIYRNGSDANCSLKLSNDTVEDLNHPLYIGGEPFKGITVKNITAGSHKATVYLILYKYNNFEQIRDRMRIKLMLPDGSIVTSAQGNWVQDQESTWNNIDESNLTSKWKCEIPFTLSDVGDVEFEYQFSWYAKTASAYVDPYPEIS